jgi:hypothetical protein
MENPQKLRELAAWYREFAEKTANPTIWEARLRMAEDLELEAARLEQREVPARSRSDAPSLTLSAGSAPD